MNVKLTNEVNKINFFAYKNSTININIFNDR